MLRPRDSHDLRLIGAELRFSPPATVRWIHDVFGNSVAIASFSEPATELRIESTLGLEQYDGASPASSLDWRAARYPFAYSADEHVDLGNLLALQYADPESRLSHWVSGFLVSPTTDTLALLADINAGVRASFGYQSREEEGTQTPVETIRRGFGCCRDFAVLFAEAARSLGFGARIASGYLYRPQDDGAWYSGTEIHGGTHAWAEIYLPGAGWIAYDPTNGTTACNDLIRVAVARDIRQVAPISGSFLGVPDDCLGLRVAARVTATNGVAQRQGQAAGW